MENNLIMFSSVTLAMRAKDLLNKNRIMCKVIRTPVNLRNRSCGYSVLVTNNFQFAMDLISSNRIPVLGIAAVDIR
ncbi:MAG: DUF3343 domain-containing protein [Ruminococcus sp.]|nr:DUF3343 domain-containing protein [Ruminococcus sp.]